MAKTCRKSATGPGPGARLPLVANRMRDAVLVLNSGSSSIKFAVFDIAADEPALLCKGLLDEHESAPRLTVNDPTGKKLHETRRAAGDNDGNGLFVDVLAWLDSYLGDKRLVAAGHR